LKPGIRSPPDINFAFEDTSMKTMLIAAAALLMAGSASAALAGGKDKVKANYDRNGDGQISLQERQTKKVAKLMRWDRDGDGRVSRAEYDAMSTRRAARQGDDAKPGKDKFPKLDANGDGFISTDEVADRVARKFARTDDEAGYDGSAQAPAGGAR
jgi:EF hand domain-containing protein